MSDPAGAGPAEAAPSYASGSSAVPLLGDTIVADWVTERSPGSAA